jgi:hypothetical protein
MRKKLKTWMNLELIAMVSRSSKLSMGPPLPIVVFSTTPPWPFPSHLKICINTEKTYKIFIF